MIDLSQLTEEQIKELELQIQKHKEQGKPVGYKVTLFVKFIPEKHKNDMLTSDGNPDEGLFTDYLFDEVISKIVNDFNLDGYGEDGYGEDAYVDSVELATEEDLQDIWGEN